MPVNDNVSLIKNKIDIVDLISNYISLKKSGNNYKGLCPFHSENTPSFMVSKELQIYKCFGCGEGGDIFSFVEQMEGVDFQDSLKILADKAGIELVKQTSEKQNNFSKTIFAINKLTAEMYHYILTKHALGKEGFEYLTKKRHLTIETIKEWQLGYAPDSWNTAYKALSKKFPDTQLVLAGVIIPRKNSNSYIDKFRNRIVFPFTGIDGKVFGFTGRVLDKTDPKYLNTGETQVFHKGKIIYGLDKARAYIKKDGAVFVEGTMDVLSAHQAGIKNVVASSGTSLTGDQLTIISRYTKDLIICFDPDTAGESAAQRGIELAEKHGFNVMAVIIPETYSDLDDMIQKDPDSAKELIKKPASIYEYFIVKAMKKFNKNDAIGKKKIIESLIPVFSKLTNSILLDHYSQKLSEDLNISQTTIKKILSEKKVPDATAFFNDKTLLVKTSPEKYFLSLLLQTNLDTMQLFVYKLETHDFTDTNLQEIFSKLKEYVLYIYGTKQRFDIQYLLKNLNKELSEILENVCLLDLGELAENEKNLLSELNLAFSRIKRGAIKQELLDLTKKIKLAESENNIKMIAKLTKEVAKKVKSFEDY